MKIQYPVMAIAGVLMIGGVLHGFFDQPAVDTSHPVAKQAATIPTSAKKAESPSRVAVPFEPTAALEKTSLRGVDVPKSLSVDSNGQLIANEGLRTLMDFFLSLTGELDHNQIRALFLAAAQQQCGSACGIDAAALFDRYSNYLNAMTQQQAQLQDQDDLRTRLQMATALRREWLGAELASGLFEYEESYDAYRVSQWEVINDMNLSAAEKQQQLELLRSSAPPGLLAREHDNDTLQSARLIQQQFKDDPSALYAARMELVGQEATDRLQQLDQHRAQWDQRYQQYRQELSVLQSAAISDEDRSQQVEQLRLRHFSDQESQRVAALDRIHRSVQ